METTLFILSAFSLILTGLFGVLTRKNLVKILLSLNILETGINLLVVSLGYFKGAEAPILTNSISAAQRLNFVDPLPQALVLTSIVIGLGTTALALTLIINHYRSQRALEFIEPEVNE